MLMLMRQWEQNKTNKWVRSSGYAYDYVAGVLTCLCFCYAYVCAYAYALVRTTSKFFKQNKKKKKGHVLHKNQIQFPKD